ncbi:hypothetical protein NDU88_002095 [Pleurodeles waltl]|uniref:Uncharacterized protein n=1 Tax=Pleurodeles waltl TaxID=8319 RepID=A0AAV7W3L6_PLEWA|nr:hypothetical protein NDU88_002095 [Pleurodeles waltl]
MYGGRQSGVALPRSREAERWTAGESPLGGELWRHRTKEEVRGGRRRTPANSGGGVCPYFHVGHKWALQGRFTAGMAGLEGAESVFHSGWPLDWLLVAVGTWSSGGTLPTWTGGIGQCPLTDGRGPGGAR